MSLSATSIKRPVLASVLSIIITLFGIIAYRYLGVREFPAIDPPTISVSTAYKGASADIIENQITEPIESSVNGISGIRSITSVSRDQLSTVTVEFNIEQDLDNAANDVRDRVSRIVRSLPTDADPPVVAKADGNSFPIILLTVQSDSKNILEVNAIGTEMRERLQTIPGVSEVRIWGEKKYAMRIAINPIKLAAYNLTLADVRTAIQNENTQLPSGRIQGDITELTVRTSGLLKSSEEFNNIIIQEKAGKLIRLQDIGKAELGPENDQTVLKKNGVPMIGLGLIAQPGANNLAIAKEFYKRWKEIEKEKPKGIKLELGFDNTSFIRRSIDEVKETIYLAFGLVVLIIFIFLRDWRTTLIPVVAIPISLIGAFFLMYSAGFTINVLTLLGIVLAIGLVVDDAIVVLENIYTKIEQGMSPREAGFKGAEEIFFAILSTTMVLVVVFLPIVFMQGFTGRLFREFALVIAGSVVISAFVSLTLTPMMSTRLLKHRAKPTWLYAVTEPWFQGLTLSYRNALNTFLRHRWVAIVLLLGAGGLIYFLGKIIPTELAPMEDRNAMMVMATAHEGAAFPYMDAFMDKLNALVAEEVPESQLNLLVTSPGFGASSAVNTGFIRIYLTDPADRKRSQKQIADLITKKTKALNDARIFVVQDQTIQVGVRTTLPVQYVIEAPTLERLKEILPKFMEEAAKNPLFSVVDVNLKFTKPELHIEVNPNRARDLGVSMLDISQTLQLAYSDMRINYFNMEGKQYQVMLRVDKAFRNKPEDLKLLQVKNREGRLISMDNLVTVTNQVSPPQLFRTDRYASATVSAGLAPGKTLGEGIKAMQDIGKKVLDPSIHTDLAGTSRDFADSSSSLLFAFLLALLLIYLMLAAQFESFRDPLTILFTVPLALAGALLSLWYFNQTLNIFSRIGMIMLIGLVTKNGILIVEFANQRRQQGLPIVEAVREAAASRFRPILMTSLATILGTLPIALALGAGSQSRMPMGIAVIGGLLFALALTLFVVPAMYTYLASKTSESHS